MPASQHARDYNVEPDEVFPQGEGVPVAAPQEMDPADMQLDIYVPGRSHGGYGGHGGDQGASGSGAGPYSDSESWQDRIEAQLNHLSLRQDQLFDKHQGYAQTQQRTYELQ